MTTGKFVWYDVMTTDIKAAETFYRNAIGWESRDSGMGGEPYTIFSAGQTMVAGLMPIPEQLRSNGARPCWTGYIGVDDVDTYVSRVKAAGGEIHRPPQDIPGIGRFGVVADPHDAVFILFSASGGEAPPPAAPGTPGQVGWHELQAGDAEADFAFYAGLFGWTKSGEGVDMGPIGRYQMFATGDQPVGGIMNKMPEVPRPFWLYYFNVDAVDAAIDRINRGGGRVVHGPLEVPGGSFIAQCLDPQGALFAIVGSRR